MISDNLFDALAEMVMDTQLLVKQGWTFRCENGKLFAELENKVYSDSCVESLFADIFRDIQRDFYNRMIAWYKEHKGLCPVCHTEPPINTYECKCGWKL